MPTNDNVISILLQAKGAEETAAKLQHVEKALDALGSATPLQQIFGAQQAAKQLAAAFKDIETRSLNVKGGVDPASIQTVRVLQVELAKARELAERLGQTKTQGAFGQDMLGKISALQSQLVGVSSQSTTALANVAAQSGKAEQTFNGATAAGRNMVESLVAGLPGIGKFALGIGALGGAVAAASVLMRPLANAISAPVREASQAEDAVRRLNISLASIGQYSQDASKQLQEFATSIQASSVYDDEAIQGVSALIAQVGRLGGGELQRATQAAIDLSSALGMDLQSAAMLVGKAAAGSTEMLGQYGIRIEESIPKAERFAAALAIIEEKFGGTAKGQIDTLSGSVAQLRNSWGDFIEVVGKPFLEPMKRFFQQASEDVRRFTKEIQGAEETVVERLTRIADKLKESQDANRFARDLEDVGFKAEIQFVVSKGSLQELEAIRDRAKEIADETQRELSDTSRGPRAILGAMPLQPTIDAMRELQREAERGIKLRIAFDEKEANDNLRTLLGKLREGESLSVKFTADDAEIQSAIKQVREPKTLTQKFNAEWDQVPTAAGFPPILVPAKFVADAADFKRQLQEMESRPELQAQVLAKLKLQVPKMNDEQLAGIQDAFKGAFDSVESMTQERAKRVVDALAPVYESFKTLRDQRVRLAVETPAIAAFQELRDAVRGAVNEAKPGVEVVKPSDLQAAKSLTAQLKLLGVEFEALRSTASAQVQSKLFESLLAKADDLAKKYPMLQSEINAFVQQQSSAFGIAIPVKFDTEQAKRQVAAMNKTFLELLKIGGAGPLQLIDAQRLATQATTAEQAMKNLSSALTLLQKTGSPTQLLQGMERLIELENTSRATGEEWAKDKQEQLALYVNAVRASIARIAPLFDVDKKIAELKFAIEIKDEAKAKAIFAELEAILAKFPKEKTVKLVVQDNAFKFASSAEKIAATYKKMAEDVTNSISSIAVEGLSEMIAAPFQVAVDAMLGDAKKLDEAMRGIFKSMVSAILRELARLWAFKLLSILLPGAGGFLAQAFGMAAGNMTAGGGGAATASKATAATPPRATPPPATTRVVVSMPTLPPARLTQPSPRVAEPRPLVRQPVVAGIAESIRLVAPKIDPVAIDVPLLIRKPKPPQPFDIPISIRQPRVGIVVPQVQRLESRGTGKSGTAAFAGSIPPFPATLLSTTEAVAKLAASQRRSSALDLADFVRTRNLSRSLLSVPQQRMASERVSSLLPRAAGETSNTINVQSYDARDMERSFRSGAGARAIRQLRKSGRI